MAWRTGEACGFTDTRSSARSSENQSAVMRLTIDALDAWCPPTFTPERFSRTRLAWWTIAVASQRTRRSIALRVSRSGVARGGDGCIAVFEPLKDCDLPISHGADDGAVDVSAHAAGLGTHLPGAGREDLVAVLLDAVELDPERVPHRRPLLAGRADLLAPAVGHELGPVRTRADLGVVGVQTMRRVDLACVPQAG